MKKYLFLALLFIPATLAYADFNREHWQYERSITLPSMSETGFVRVKLDRFVAGGSSGFRDIRMLQGDREIPYQFSVETDEVRAQYIPTQVLDAGVDAEGRLQFILDLGKSGTLHSQIHIETDSPNYKRQVSVFAAPSLIPHTSTGWLLLSDQGYIFKFSDKRTGFSTDSGEVSYPQSSARYLRVVVEGGSEGPLSLSSASIYRYEISSAKEETESLPADVLQKKDEQTTEIIFDLERSGIPTHKISLFVTDKGNFSRTAYLFGSNDATHWSRIGQGHLSQIETVKFTGRSLSIAYPESTYQFYKISIQNFDDAPLEVQNRVEVTHIIRTVVFEASPNTSYTLYYGNPAAYAPRYDLSRYFEYLETTSLPEASLGPERDNPDYVSPTPPVIPFTERNKVLLNVTLALLVLIAAAFIFWYIFRHVRQNQSAVLPETVVPPPAVVPPTQASGNEGQKP